MYVSFGKYSVQIHVCPSKDQMTNLLEGCEAGNLVLREGLEQELEFYAVVIYLDTSKLRRFGIGICTQGHGLTPGLLLLPEKSTLIFGYDSSVTAVRIPEGTIDFGLSLDSLFYSFTFLHDRKVVLVLHEIGIVALTREGRVIWKFSRDVVTDLAIGRDFLTLKFMGAQPARLKISDGRLLE